MDSQNMRLEEFNERFNELVRETGVQAQGVLILNDGRSFTVNGVKIGEDPSSPQTWHATQELLCMGLHVLYMQREHYIREVIMREQVERAQREAANAPKQ